MEQKATAWTKGQKMSMLEKPCAWPPNDVNLLFTVLFVVFALVNIYIIAVCCLPESPKRKGAKKARTVDGLGLGLGLRHVHG